jgi:hypothetical protein
MKHPKSLRGQSIIEFAFMVVIMATIMLGVANFALAMQQAMLVVEASTEGALYGSFTTYNANQTAAAQSAAATSAAGAKGLTTVASISCACEPGGVWGVTACTTTCVGNSPLKYFKVTSTSSFSSLFHYAGLPTTFSLGSTVVIPVN